MKLYLFGYLSNTTVDNFQTKLMKLKKQEKIQIFIDSQGGEIEAFFRLYFLLKPLKNRITTIAMNYCSSASASVFLLGKNRLILPNCTFIMHRPGFYVDPKNPDSRFTTLSIKNLYDRFLVYDEDYKNVLLENNVPQSIVDEIFESEVDISFPTDELLNLGMATDIANITFILKE